jgi:dipeptidase E
VAPCRSMLRIVAIGGGELPGLDAAGDTTELDAEVVRLANVRRPRLLFLPTATGDDDGYVDLITAHYGQRLGCRVEPLPLYDRARSRVDIERSIAGADIVYVGGGNTLRMMNLWRRRGVDRLLTRAATQGTVLAGISAGAICWCAAGVSDSRSFTAGEGPWDYIAVRGLGLLDVLLAPHYNADPRRQDALGRIARNRRLLGVGLDDGTALEIVDDQFRIIACRKGAMAHCVDRAGVDHDLPAHDDLRPLTNLTEHPPAPGLVLEVSPDV